MKRSTTKARVKSTTPDITLEIGMASRGKNTFLMRFALPTRLSADCARLLAKNVQGTSAAYAKIGYGTPSDGIRASRPKNRLNTTMVKKGWIMAHAAPSAVCLYLTLMSRHVRKYTSSRYCHNSRRRSDTHPVGGAISM